jgi:hypothetical protein
MLKRKYNVEFWQELERLFIYQKIQNDISLNKPNNNEYDHQLKKHNIKTLLLWQQGSTYIKMIQIK